MIQIYASVCNYFILSMESGMEMVSDSENVIDTFCFEKLYCHNEIAISYAQTKSQVTAITSKTRTLYVIPNKDVGMSMTRKGDSCY